ncbi:hypothetical protein TNIN_407551 [Trichonephila inaurata madagascariensis]|uniref:Uncharacterized protein n=1 Tax=Trichonephila inaurata madagascariensis TaxID=2747483 RepID=A0A8X6IVG6_9ARAC|nr:hypothetical protein TNIN_407551 [Trichonephila inaurata madagascariensis]
MMCLILYLKFTLASPFLKITVHSLPGHNHKLGNHKLGFCFSIGRKKFQSLFCKKLRKWLDRRRIETDGSSATLCRKVFSLSSVRIFRWAPLPGQLTTEPSSTK